MSLMRSTRPGLSRQGANAVPLALQSHKFRGCAAKALRRPAKYSTFRRQLAVAPSNWPEPVWENEAMDPNDVADRYFEVVRNRDVDGLVALYAADAVITLPHGAQVAGIDAIRAFQTDVNGRAAPYPTPGPRTVGASEIAVEIKAQLPDGTVRNTANFFYLNEAGLIERLSVYAQAS
jgi:hypothetical protein